MNAIEQTSPITAESQDDRPTEVVGDHHLPFARRVLARTTSASPATAALSVGDLHRRIAVLTYEPITVRWPKLRHGRRCQGEHRHPDERDSDQEASAHPATPSHRWTSSDPDTFHVPSTSRSVPSTLWVATVSLMTAPVARSIS